MADKILFAETEKFVGLKSLIKLEFGNGDFFIEGVKIREL